MSNIRELQATNDTDLSSITKDRVDVLCHGKPFQIGVLYDCATETLHEDHYLWDMNKLEEDATKKEEISIDYSWSVEDETKKKGTHLGLKAGMKFSFLSSVFEAGASAKYNYDRTTMEKEVRAILTFHVTTGYTRINKFKNIFDREMYERALEKNFFGATHLVTRVTYGCDAHFEFTRSIHERETKHEVATELKAVLNCIAEGGGSAEIGATIKRSVEEIKDSYRFTCRGDIILDSNPTTFDEVLTAYKSLSTSTKKYPKPIIANIVPLFDFMKLLGIPQCPKYLVRPIKPSLLRKVQNLLEKLFKKRNELYDLSEHNTCKQLTALKEEILKCIENIAESEEDIKDDMKRLIPAIRRFENEENDLRKLIENGNQAYAIVELDVKLVRKKISQLSYYLEKIEQDPNIMMVTDDEKEKAVNSSCVVCFAFNSAITVSTNEIDHCIQRMVLRVIFNHYVSFAQVNAKSKTQFIVTETNREATNLGQGVLGDPETVLYEEGCTMIFELPSEPKPNGLILLHNHPGDVLLRWMKPDLGAENILYYSVQYHNKKWKRWKTAQSKEPEIKITLDPTLQPNREYEFIIRAVSKAGISTAGTTTIKIPRWINVELQ